jgi:hypothetical protein
MAEEVGERGISVRDELVEASKAAEFRKYDKMPTLDVIAEMHALRQQKDALEAQMKQINKHYDFLRIVKIPDQFANEQLKIVKIDGIGRVNLKADLFASIKTGQKEAAFEWLRDTGHGGIIKPAIHSATFKAAVKEMLKNGEEIPEQFFNVSPYQTAIITKT